MELKEFLENVSTDFPLEYDNNRHLFLIFNSGRRGNPKSFYMPLQNILSAFITIKNNITAFSATYVEDTWRDTEQLFNDNQIKTFMGVQTRPFFETINKIITWANNKSYQDGEMVLTDETIKRVLETFGITENAKYNIYPKQIIYYGVPGCGKSYEIDKIIKSLEAQPSIENVKYTRRVVFHPEYTNADFIGQILPTMEGSGIKYNFIPGNFTKILKDAYRNPTKQFALVIEEINRGNAAAIFGDIFQLLDRLFGSETDSSANDQFTYTSGWSKYGIDNSDVIHEILKDSEGNAEPLNLEINGHILHLNYNSAIRLPPNLSIYATMNTSDQNVFTLDNAFQRRWDMQLVKNECNDSNQIDSKIIVKKKYITWKDFQEQINKVIGEKSNESGLSSMEDKRLGCWFVKAENKTISTETFSNKVLKYLWDDALKFYHTEIFKEGIKNFEELQKEFNDIGFDVFNDVCELKDKIHSIEENTESDFQLEAE